MVSEDILIKMAGVTTITVSEFLLKEDDPPLCALTLPTATPVIINTAMIPQAIWLENGIALPSIGNFAIVSAGIFSANVLNGSLAKTELIVSFMLIPYAPLVDIKKAGEPP
jgi:hypothetical protein